MSNTLYPPNSSPTSYSTPAEWALIKKILSECDPPIELHDYQTEGICKALDGIDVISTMATGTGKTGLFSFLMLVVRAISQDPTLVLGTARFPKNPCMLVICPTKALEDDMVLYIQAISLAIFDS
jgi:superfamily II DNA/RNA helicase